MGLRKEDDNQVKLNEAEDEASVLDALDAMIPNTADLKGSLESFQKHRHHQFVEQLQMIDQGIPSQMTAIRHYLQDSKMRIRWKERNLNSRYLQRFRQTLYEIYQRHFELNKRGREADAVRGNATYTGTIEEANHSQGAHIPCMDSRIELPDGTIAGEYHHMANGEDGVEVGWHPDWKRKLETGEINE